jgi:hypothetical protein
MKKEVPKKLKGFYGKYFTDPSPKPRITGRGLLERMESDSESDEEVSNGKKIFLNGGKFAVNMDKLRKNFPPCVLRIEPSQYSAIEAGEHLQ